MSDEVRPPWPYPAWSLTLPQALPFPRGPYQSTLEEHARLFDEHQRSLRAQIGDATDLMDVVCVIQTRNQKTTAVLGERDDAARATIVCRGVLRRLLEAAPDDCIYVLVFARGVASLHVARIDPEELVIVARDVVVEPVAQKHRRTGHVDFAVTEWMHPDGERRYAWVPLPSQPATDEEAIDRIFARDASRARREVWRFLATGERRSPLVQIWCMPTRGDLFDVLENDALGLDKFCPKIAAAIAEYTKPGLAPVFILLGHSAGLRWLDVGRADKGPLPPSIFEPRAGSSKPAVAYAPPVFPKDPKPRRKLRGMELLETIDRWGVDDEIDLYLANMTREQLDAEIVEAGFSPRVEHATCWLRYAVIQAIADEREMKEPERSPMRRFAFGVNLHGRPISGEAAPGAPDALRFMAPTARIMNGEIVARMSVINSTQAVVSVAATPFTLRFASSAPVEYVGEPEPPEPPLPVQIDFPFETEVVFEATIALDRYKWSGTPTVSLEWSFHFVSGPSHGSTVSVELPHGAA